MEFGGHTATRWYHGGSLIGMVRDARVLCERSLYIEIL